MYNKNFNVIKVLSFSGINKTIMVSLGDRRNGRRQYLVMYAQADEVKFPTRESFGRMLEREFNAGRSVGKVSHWACCRELHKDGGAHYHCSIKLTGLKKWWMVKEAIQEKHRIVVHFSDEHDYYISAYRYVVKEDPSVVYSEGHANLAEAKSPPTKKSIAANWRRRKNQGDSSKGAGTTSAKRRRLSRSNAASFIRENNIHPYTELMTAAETRRLEGLKDISEYIYSHSEKKYQRSIDEAMANAGSTRTPRKGSAK